MTPYLLLVSLFGPVFSSASASESSAYFEAEVLPVLRERCFECHSHAAKIKGGLALDSRSGWEIGGDHGAAVLPGQPDKSLLINAVRYKDSELEMPPKGKLSPREIDILEKWVKDGAVDPREGTAVVKESIDLEAGRQFWAFQPIQDPEPPQVRASSWPLDLLDHFILAKLEENQMAPVPDADRHAWLRRVSLDLMGLPPTPTEIKAFMEDSTPDAFEKVVDRLLASRAYGERWARHWLDLTGYADMMGTSNNVFAEHAWRYRDYLIEAFHADKPFDEFIREQIAGDLIPADSIEDRAENIVATGFLMVGDIEIVNPDKAKMETDHIDTQVIKIGQAFLGMTLGCVRCHDHKFDPIGLEDYYAIAGMLRSSPSSHKMPDMGVWSALNAIDLPETPAQLAARQKLETETEQRIANLKEEQEKLNQEKNSVLKQLAALGQPIGASRPGVATDNAEREVAPAAVDQPEPGKDSLTKRRDELEANIKSLASAIQHAEFFKSKVPKAFAMSDGPEPGDMPIYIRGNPYAPSTLVPRGAIRVASWAPFPEIPEGQSGRPQLADWLADKRNPLTPRVTVNRIWQKLFGTGIVPGVDYFGTRGERPTHPELLDHLATRFLEGGGSQKAFLRFLVLSRTYRMSSANDLAAMQTDPENKLYWRMNRQRLDAEALRDSLLAVSGELTLSRGGPALVLENPANCGSLSLKGVNPPNYTHRVPRPSQEFERTIYLPIFRTSWGTEDKLRAAFDFVNPAMIAGERSQTIVPTQLLFLLNNDLLRKRATVLAKKLMAEDLNDLNRLEVLWLRLLNRPITPVEQDEALAFLNAVEPLITPGQSEAIKWIELCHSLLSSNEFLFRL